ncbi:MAG: hypothetical protein KBG28_14925 [Kofleriaceae bacterium]|nr:hypothetical protein [Kofleriaceae bacterium]
MADSTAAAAPAAPAAAAYRSDTGRYLVATTFGAVSEKDLADPQGVIWHTAEWRTRSGMYSVQYADFASPEAARREMEVFRATEDPSEVKVDRALTLQGRPGRQYEVSTRSGLSMAMRFMVDGARVLKIVGGTKRDHASVAAFLDGVTLIGAAPAAAATASAPAEPVAPANESAAMNAGRRVVALFQRATQLGVDAAGDCAAFSGALEPVRAELWQLGGEHPGLFRTLGNADLQVLGAADAQEALGAQLIRCKDTVGAKEIAFALGRFLDAPAATATPAAGKGRQVRARARARAADTTARQPPDDFF